MLRGSEVHDVRARAREWWAARGGAGPRWDPGRPALASVVLVSLTVLAVASWWVLHGQPRRLGALSVATAGPTATVPVGGSLASPAMQVSGQGTSGAVASGPPMSGGSTSPAASGGAGSAMLIVDVVGKVRRPGVYRLMQGARVDDAVRAAGGAVRGFDLTGLNLARKVVDGEQIAVGVQGAADAAPAQGDGVAGGGARSDQTGPLDLNSATVAQLDALPGVGPVLAQRIVDWRTQHARFDSVDQLKSVTGVGDAKFADLQPLVVVR